MKSSIFKDLDFYYIVGFVIAVCTFAINRVLELDPRDEIIKTLLWVMVFLLGYRQIFVGRIKIIIFSMLIVALIPRIVLATNIYSSYINDFFIPLWVDYYPVFYSIFNFLYGKLKHTSFTIFESVLLGIICIPVIPAIDNIYVTIIIIIYSIFEISNC